MSTQTYSSHQQTRQQLEELDALLQRMLSLPAHAAEPEPAAAAAVSAEAFAPLPPTLPRMTFTPPESSGPLTHAWRLAPVRPPEDPPLAMAVDAAPDPLTTTPAPYPYSLVFGQPLPSEAPPMPEAEALAETGRSAPRGPAPAWAIPVPEAPAGTSLFALPFVAINAVFDLLCFILGPLGGVLRKHSVRNVFGWLGIFMIIGAIGWAAAEWFHLDWPR